MARFVACRGAASAVAHMDDCHGGAVVACVGSDEEEAVGSGGGGAAIKQMAGLSPEQAGFARGERVGVGKDGEASGFSVQAVGPGAGGIGVLGQVGEAESGIHNVLLGLGGKADGIGEWRGGHGWA